MLNPILQNIVFGSALVENILNAKIKWFSDESTIGPLVDTWITYPQSISAGIIAYSILGSNLFGQIALASFVVSPLIFKSIKTLSIGKLAKTAEYADTCERIAAKIVNLIDIAAHFKRQTLLSTAQLLASITFTNQIFSVFRDITDSINYYIIAGETTKSLFLHKKWSL